MCCRVPLFACNLPLFACNLPLFACNLPLFAVQNKISNKTKNKTKNKAAARLHRRDGDETATNGDRKKTERLSPAVYGGFRNFALT
jgi:hypothetical protein